MTALRAVRPNRAWDARSSSPMYASTSTIRPTRRAGVAPSSRTRRAPSSAGAASRVGRPKSAARASLSWIVGGYGRTSGGRPG